MALNQNEIPSSLQRSGYQFDDAAQIWKKPEYCDLPYSDGQAFEERLLEVLRGARDLSVLSSELQRNCIDWPSLYHLSAGRANLLRPLREHLQGTILELGAGCGAITRFLGESGAKVVAVEGTTRRASIARQRTRDLPNVNVVAEEILAFQSDIRFEVVTLIGVLEYGGLLVGVQDPHRALLEHARKLLKPDGILILAIENRYGLKYLAGAPEDHLGVPMVGVENRYPEHGAKTFGKSELSDLLERAGYGTVEFAAPLPDYKLPGSIVTTRGANDKTFDAAQLFWQSARSDPQRVRAPSFLLERVWPGIVANKLAMDLSNSFLVVASPASGREIFSPDLLAAHYSTERRPEFCKQVEFRRGAAESVITITEPLVSTSLSPGSDTISGEPSNFIHVLVRRDDYWRGRLFVEGFRDIVTRPGWLLDEVCVFLKSFMNAIASLTRAEGAPVEFLQSTTTIPGRYLDAHTGNLALLEDGQCRLFDLEWQATEPISTHWFLLRSLWASIGSVSLFAARGSDDLPAQLSLGQFCRSILAGVGFPISDIQYNEVCTEEIRFQRWVNGGYCAATLAHFQDAPLKPECVQLWEHSREVLSLREDLHRVLVDKQSLLNEQRELARDHAASKEQVLSLREDLHRVLVDKQSLLNEQRELARDHAATEQRLLRAIQEEQNLAATLRSQIVRAFETHNEVQARVRSLEHEVKRVQDHLNAVVTTPFVRVGSKLGLVPYGIQRNQPRQS